MSHIYTLTSSLTTVDLENKKVLLRADLNVPLAHDRIASDFRLKALKPTLDILVAKKACILLITHIGQPVDQDPHVSTKLLIPWFKEHEYTIVHAQTIEEAAKLFAPSQIVLLENIRFWSEEKAQSPALAHALRACTAFFVQDAFGTLHRNDTTIAHLPLLYAQEHRTIGLLVERELAALNAILVKPKKPVFACIGGAKIATKLPLIHNLLSLAPCVALLPPLSLAFAHAKNQQTGATPIDATCNSIVRTILGTARKKNKRLLLPTDYLVSTNGWAGPYTAVSAKNLASNEFVITIGPETVLQYQQESAQAHTIIFNGPSGELAYPATCFAVRDLLASWCNSSAYRLVAGADSLALLQYFDLQKCVSYCSSGGGASITYLSGKKLPGLEPFVVKRVPGFIS